MKVETFLKTLESALENVYLYVTRDNLNSGSEIISPIKQTSLGVYGNSIITVDCKNNTIKKDIQTLRLKVEISKKAVRSCHNNITALVELVNSVMEDAINRGQEEQLTLLATELNKDLGCDIDLDTILTFLRNIDKAWLNNHATMHVLCDWEWLRHNDKIMQEQDNTYTATLVKYCNFTFSQEFLDYVREKLLEG